MLALRIAISSRPRLCWAHMCAPGSACPPPLQCCLRSWTSTACRSWTCRMACSRPCPSCLSTLARWARCVGPCFLRNCVHMRTLFVPCAEYSSPVLPGCHLLALAAGLSHAV